MPARLALLLFALIVSPIYNANAIFAEDEKINILFLGDAGHHRPSERFRLLRPVLEKRNIDVHYTEDVDALNKDNLAKYHGLIVYANIAAISPAQEAALLEYVENGNGFIPLHCASYCFLNSQKYIELVGGQFQRHNVGTFRVVNIAKKHPIMQGYGGFESWDETYVHHKHNEKNRTVLEQRLEGAAVEPWTWIRTQGKGRVFYTAWGHDYRTWTHPGFHNLLERGIRWAIGYDVGKVPTYMKDLPFPVPQMTAKRADVAPFEFAAVGAQIPNYTPGRNWGTQGAAKTKMQKPLPAEESIKHLRVPQGFRVELFAADPDIEGKPICMKWDERGRLWIAETYDYPNELQPAGKGRDRIRICEDTDGDWKADKFTVFADKLSIPTSMMFHRGGLIVFDGTKTLYFKDNDGDDVADTRQVLFGDWNQGDTHGGPSNMQYGLDNYIWAMQGYNNSKLKVGNEIHEFRMGFFRFKPDGSKMEFIRSTNNNTWGLGISEEGIIFGSTANRNPSVYMPIPNRYYESVRGWAPSLMLGTIADTYMFQPSTDKIRQVDQHGGYTAAAGHALYTARRYPQEYWNRTAFVNGPTGHLVGTFVLKPQGADFQSSSPFNLLSSDDEWTAPIMSEVGPDGNVWVIDWYNYIVQHNPTPRGFKTGQGNAYETQLRDKKHGRIYRVVYEGDDEPYSLLNASPEKLVATLSHGNMFWRKHAQRLLVERGELDVQDSLLALIKNSDVDELGLNVGAIHALWTLHGLDAMSNRSSTASIAATDALTHPSPGVRRNAVQVLTRHTDSAAAIATSDLLNDSDSQVRLAAALALADLPPSPAAGRAVASALNSSTNAIDRWMPDALTSAAANNATYFLMSLGKQEQPSGKLAEITSIVAEHYARGRPNDLALVVSRLRETDADSAEAVIRGLAKGWPSDHKVELTDEFEAEFDRLAKSLPAGTRGQLVRLASSWGSEKFGKYAEEISDSLLKLVGDPKLRTAQRLAAANELISFQRGDLAVASALLNLVTPRTDPELATGLISSLQACEHAKLGDELVRRIRNFTPSARRTVIQVLLSRADWTGSLLTGVDNGRLDIAELSLDQKQALNSHSNPDLRTRAATLLKRGGMLPDADRQKVIEQLISVTKEKGNADNGKVIFVKQCAKCHTHSGEGTRIGPDMTGMAVHPKEELLVHILDPNRSVEGNFRVYGVVTVDGKIINGLLASESKTAVEVFDAEGKKRTILREDIDELNASRKSLMPEGFEKQVTRSELSDLLEFLTKRGKFLPLDIRKAATITSVRGMFIDKNADVERLIFPAWKPQFVDNVPFLLIDPQDGKIANTILLHGPNGEVCSKMPKSVSVTCNSEAKAIHLLSGVSGWGFPFGEKGSVSMTVRLHYDDGQSEDHDLKNGEHFADYIRRVDVPKSKLAFQLRGQQLRYLAIYPKRANKIVSIDFVKGLDRSAPIVMAVTVEGK